MNFEVRVLHPKRALARFGRPTSLAGGPDEILARPIAEAGTVTLGGRRLLGPPTARLIGRSQPSCGSPRSRPRCVRRLRHRSRHGAGAALPSAQERNIVEHLPEAERPLVLRRPRAAPAEPDPKRAKVALFVIAGGLAHQRPGVAASLREGLADTLTINHSRARRASFGARSSRPTRWSC